MTSVVTRLTTLLHGRFVGSDSFANRYYEHKRKPSRRWVVYAARYEDASQVPCAWHAWLHHTSEQAPNAASSIRHKHSWQKEHRANQTGGEGAFSPKSGLLAERAYEAWTPETRSPADMPPEDMPPTNSSSPSFSPPATTRN